MNPQKKKKPSINPFSCFAVEYKRKEEQKGRRLSMQDAVKESADTWKNMTEWEKAPYEQEAKIQKAQFRVSGTKYTSQGISLDEIEAEKREKQKAIEEMESYIVNRLQTAVHTGRLEEEVFYFISTNYFYQTHLGDIYPAEMGMAKYSLKNGVFASFHMFINPGKLPLGASNDAQEHSNATHKLPIPPGAKGETNYYEMFGKILAFIDDKDFTEMPVFFTNSNELKETKAALEKIIRESEEPDLQVKVYPIENLFYPLKKYSSQLKNEANRTNDKGFPSIFIAKDMIDKDKYRYTLDLGCKFHDLEDCASQCAQSRVTRWGFVISDHCVLDLGLSFKPGYHVPRNCDTDISIVAARSHVKKDTSDTIEVNDNDYDDDDDDHDDVDWKARQKPYKQEQGNAWGNIPVRKYESCDNTSYHNEFPSFNDTKTSHTHKKDFTRPSAHDQSSFSKPETSFKGFKNNDDNSYASVTSSTGRGRGLYSKDRSFTSSGRGRSRPRGGFNNSRYS